MKTETIPRMRCTQCGESEVIIRCDNVICLKCGYEETKDTHFARKMGGAILATDADGFDRTAYLVSSAKAYFDPNFLLDS